MKPLTPHFSQEELGVAGAERRVIDNATFLCAIVLEPIRQHFQAPVNIHDGYRPPDHNARVGGKIDSFHLYEGGHAAADFDVNGDKSPTYKQVFDWIKLESHLPFDKVILERNATGADATIHIQVDRNAPPRRQAFTGDTGNGQVYTQVEVK